MIVTMKNPSTPSVSFLLNPNKLQAFMSFYDHNRVENRSPYVVFSARDEGLTIHVYQNKKNIMTVVIQGERCHQEASLWMDPLPSLSKSFTPHYGSDEVGTGDFFGPVVVTASYVDKTSAQLLIQAGVKDSKDLTDEIMIELARTFKDKIPHITTVVNPKKYDQLIRKGMNLNMIKALLHHHAIITLHDKVGLKAQTIIDQFASEKNMALYLKGLPIIPSLVLEEKAENKFLAVAISSIFARVRFIEAMNQLSKEYNMTIPYGASSYVENFAYEFAVKFGLEALKDITKSNFKTLTRIEEKLSS
jgi:ribonuclease HIII